MSTNTTITFSVKDDSRGIKIELDDTLNTDSKGIAKRSFAYGERAFFRVYAENLSALSVCATAGTITDHGTKITDMPVTYVSFTDAPDHSFTHPVSAVSSYEWFGRNLGKITKSALTKITCETAPDVSNGVIGIAAVTMSAPYRLFDITLADQSRGEFPVLIDVR
jgi:hypothetical protein